MGRDPLHERIAGSLMAAAIGDALGAPTEGCSRAAITHRYGGLVRDFQPHAADASAVGLRPGEATDDTSQLLAFARALITCSGELDAARWTAVLRDWLLTSPKARLAGPSTKRLLHSGEERPSGWLDDATVGATNGAAMRVAPAGLVCPGDVERAVGVAWVCCQPTHDTQVAAAAAGAIAGGVAVALTSRGDLAAVVGACRRGAQLGEALGRREGRQVPARSVADQIELAVSAAAGTPGLEIALDQIAARVGTSGLAVESIPAAIGVLVAARGQPYEAIVAGASIGGDCDTIASMAGALAGAFRGLEGIPTDLLARFDAANDEDLAGVAKQLYELARHRTT
jgi:ADP-ribosylglycohydrolase